MRGILLILGAVLVLGLPATSQTLQLKSGVVLIGEVQQAHEEGLTFRRLDNGGVLDLRWNHLSPECAGRIKQLFNLAAEDDDEVTVTADEVTYEISGVPHVVLGKIVEQDQTPFLIVQRKGIPVPVPRDSIKTVRRVEVPVTQIYTRDEFYSSKLEELAPGEDADKHVSLAMELMRVRDYDNAEHHLLKARDLGNSLQPNAIQGALTRLVRYRDSEEERRLLDEIGVRRSRRDFVRGLELIEEFAQEYPDSKLQSEFEKEKQRFDNARTRYLTGEVNEAWKRLIRSTAEQKVSERGVTLAMVRDYAGSQMGEDIANRVAQSLELDVQEVRELWAKRTDYPGIARRREYFSYGLGSWVLGPNGVTKDTVQGEEEEQTRVSSEDREIERFARRIRQARERYGQSQGGQRGGQSRNTEEDWWETADRNERVGWLRAYYAENGGDLLLHRAYVKACINCVGTGTVEQQASTGNSVRVQCFLCRGTRFVRTLRAY